MLWRPRYRGQVSHVSKLCVQVLEYNTNLVATVVLSDPEGQDWANSKPYNDGEAVSAAVQFWWYHMQVQKKEEVVRAFSHAFSGTQNGLQ